MCKHWRFSYYVGDAFLSYPLVSSYHCKSRETLDAFSIKKNAFWNETCFFIYWYSSFSYHFTISFGKWVYFPKRKFKFINNWRITRNQLLIIMLFCLILMPPLCLLIPNIIIKLIYYLRGTWKCKDFLQRYICFFSNMSA